LTIACPQCGSNRIFKDGLRPAHNDSIVQRWVCRDCYYRFSDGGSIQKIVPSFFKNRSGNIGECQVCDVLTEESKNLTELTRQETAQREATPQILEYAWKAKKRGLADISIEQRIYRLRLLTRKGADLSNPDSVETVLAVNNWSPANKKLFISAYKSFTKMFNIPWDPPRVKAERKLPFIPTETEIDQLISVCGKKTATFLQVLKESGARRGEIGRLRWTDVDTGSSTIRINNPLKGSSARIAKISGKAMAMINAMPRTNDYIFNPNTSTMAKGFMKQRNRLAKKLQNPRLKQIHFHTLRHWKATMEYHKTKDILHVMQVLGHKNINNTLMYTQLINFENDDYHCKTAKTLKEDQELIEAGFEFVTERDGTKIYRKRK